MKTAPSRRLAPEPAFFSPQVAQARRFYLNLQPPRHTKLAVVCGGLEHCRPDYAIHRPTFSFYAIEYVARGRGELRLAGRKYPLQPGRLFGYGPHVPHHISGNPGDPLVKYFVDFTGTGAPALLRACRVTAGCVSRVFPPNAIAALFDEIISAGLHGGKRGAKLSTALLGCLVQKIVLSAAPHEGPDTAAFKTYQNCRAHIEQCFLQLRTLEQIARECHINNAYLCRLFRRYDQGTPYQYLLRLKMNHAAERLQTFGLLVKQVAEETGFPDPFHFSRVFRSVFGLSPDSFRKLR